APGLRGEATRARGGGAPEDPGGGGLAGGVVAGAAGLAPAGAGTATGPSRATGSVARGAHAPGARRGGSLAAGLAAVPLPPRGPAVSHDPLVHPWKAIAMGMHTIWRGMWSTVLV